MKRILPILLFAILSLNSCTSRYDVMFKDLKDFVYADLVDYYNEDYILAPSDIISFRLATKDGQQLIEQMAGINTQTTSSGQNNRQQMQRMMAGGDMQFVIEEDGTVNLPVLDRVKLGGKTLKEAEFYLEELFSQFFIKPFVQIEINNQRVIVSPGDGSRTQVVNLTNRNTTVFEAIAMAGGISSSGNAKKIRLIRKNDQGEYDVYKLDLSTLAGLPQADMVVQANDIIYIQPTRNYVREVLSEISPYLALLSNVLLVYSLVVVN